MADGCFVIRVIDGRYAGALIRDSPASESRRCGQVIRGAWRV